MSLHKYTQKELKERAALKFNSSYLSGDYTDIKEFPDYSIFDNDVKFGDCTKFGLSVIFQNRAEFGRFAIFGNFTSFGNDIIFGDNATFSSHTFFGNNVTFGDFAKFSDSTTFGSNISFGSYARFGEDTKFGKNIDFENGKVKNGQFVTVNNIGSEGRIAYFYRDGEGQFFVRAGCWFSEMSDFRDRVKEIHSGTIHEKTYLTACDYAMTVLNAMAEEGKE